MVLQRSFMVFALAALLVSAFTFAVATPVSAESAAPANAELCREADAAGELETLGGITRGECVNLLSGSETDSNVIAAACGSSLVQAFTNTTNKGQCIKVERELV